VGEIPPVPLFALPNLSLLSASTGAFTPDVTSSLTSVPGITVSPARCDEPGVLASGSTSTVVTGDGGVVTSDGDSSVVNDGNGAGMVTQGSVSIVNDGNGAGTYTDTATGVSIINSGNGAGSYTDAHLSVTVDGTGGGSYTNSQTGESITITGDGSGTYTAGTVSIVNDGNGAGTYTDTATGLNIINDGTGSALITSASGSRTVNAEKLPAVENVGSFPPIDAAKPVESCGTVMTLQDGVLFDFGSSQVRSDAAQTLKNLADVMNRAGASSRTAASDPRTTARASPASPGRGVARTRTTAPMGRSYQSSLPRTRALRREALPSTSVTARSVSTAVRRGPATTRGSVCTVPRSVTVRPSAAARVRGSSARLHEPAADTASTAAIASTASRMLAITDPRADPSGASAPGRGS